MSGDISIIITMVAIGVALATFMFALFRLQERRIDKLEQRIEKLDATVQELAKDVAELKGAINIIRDGLRIRVGETADAD